MGRWQASNRSASSSRSIARPIDYCVLHARGASDQIHCCCQIEYSQMVDVYAFGVILQEFLTHRTPWDSEAAEVDYIGAIWTKVSTGERPGGSIDLVPCPFPGWTGLRDQCWHQDPATRPSFEEAFEALNSWQYELVDVPSSHNTPRSSSQLRYRSSSHTGRRPTRQGPDSPEFLPVDPRSVRARTVASTQQARNFWLGGGNTMAMDHMGAAPAAGGALEEPLLRRGLTG